MELSIRQVYQPSIRSVFTDRLHLNVTPQIKGKIYQPSLLESKKTTRLVKKKTQKTSKKDKIIKKSKKVRKGLKKKTSK